MFFIHRLKHSFVWDNDCLLMFVTFIQRLVSVGLDGHATINVWDWKKGKIIATVRGHSDRVSFNLLDFTDFPIIPIFYKVP